MSSGRPSTSGARNSEVERIIATADVDTTFAGKKNRYRGRRATWPGALALFVIFVGSIVGLAYYGIDLHANVKKRLENNDILASRFGDGTAIDDGRPIGDDDKDIEVTNPEMYEDRECEQPNYVSKDGRILAEFSDGSNVQIDIKGVNWLGMEDKKGVVKGLWDNTRDGSTLYRVTQFLKRNKFNAVRIPLSIDAVARNTKIDLSLINSNSNRALSAATRYLSFLSLLVRGLGQANIGVVLDFHVLSAVSPDDSGLWYGSSIRLDDIKKAISNLAEELCDSKHYNIIGLDLKDGLSGQATWGDDTETDWRVAAKKLGDHLAGECSNWLAFVQGVEGPSHKDTYSDDRSIKSKFLPGSDLSNLKKYPLKLKKENKVVFSPKFYTSSYLPKLYFFDGGKTKGNMLDDVIESDDKTLLSNVNTNMNYSFGPALENEAAVVLSSFGGLMGKHDKTTMKTSSRIVGDVIKSMANIGTRQPNGKYPIAGGFWWTLNPETSWPYPAPNNSDATNMGLLTDTWREAEMAVLKGLESMDKLLKSAKTIPCKN